MLNQLCSKELIPCYIPYGITGNSPIHKLKSKIGEALTIDYFDIYDSTNLLRYNVWYEGLQLTDSFNKKIQILPDATTSGTGISVPITLPEPAVGITKFVHLDDAITARKIIPGIQLTLDLTVNNTNETVIALYDMNSNITYGAYETYGYYLASFSKGYIALIVTDTCITFIYKLTQQMTGNILINSIKQATLPIVNNVYNILIGTQTADYQTNMTDVTSYGLSETPFAKNYDASTASTVPAIIYFPTQFYKRITEPTAFTKFLVYSRFKKVFFSTNATYSDTAPQYYTFQNNPFVFSIENNQLINHLPWGDEVIYNNSVYTLSNRLEYMNGYYILYAKINTSNKVIISEDLQTWYPCSCPNGEVVDDIDFNGFVRAYVANNHILFTYQGDMEGCLYKFSQNTIPQFSNGSTAVYTTTRVDGYMQDYFEGYSNNFFYTGGYYYLDCNYELIKTTNGQTWSATSGFNNPVGYDDYNVGDTEAYFLSSVNNYYINQGDSVYLKKVNLRSTSYTQTTLIQVPEQFFSYIWSTGVNRIYKDYIRIDYLKSNLICYSYTSNPGNGTYQVFCIHNILTNKQYYYTFQEGYTGVNSIIVRGALLQITFVQRISSSNITYYTININLSPICADNNLYPRIGTIQQTIDPFPGGGIILI